MNQTADPKMSLVADNPCVDCKYDGTARYGSDACSRGASPTCAVMFGGCAKRNLPFPEEPDYDYEVEQHRLAGL